MNAALTGDTLAKLHAAVIAAGLLPADDPRPVDGVPSEAAAAAIEAWIEAQIGDVDPDDASCRRYHAANGARFAQGERARLRHVLFAVTPGVDVNALRRRAEACLLDLRASDDASAFERAATELSNCPSGAQGGGLGWVAEEDCAPEFAQEVFGHSEVGVLPRLVTSRFGLHVVEVLEREAGVVPPFEAVQGAVRQQLRQQAWSTAVRQLLERL